MQAKFALSRQSQLVRSVLLGSGSSLGFGVTCDLGTNLLTSWPSVDLSELGRIELWCLQDLDLADEDILEWVDPLACLHDVLANELWHEFLDSLDQLTRRDLFGHDVSHLLANGTDLGRLCVGSLADLEWALLGLGLGGNLGSGRGHGRFHFHVALRVVPDEKCEITAGDHKGGPACPYFVLVLHRCIHAFNACDKRAKKLENLQP